MNTDIIIKTTESGMPFFETESPVVLYGHGTPPEYANIEITATLQLYPNPKGDSHIEIWTEGMHIRVPLTDIVALVVQGTETLQGFLDANE